MSSTKEKITLIISYHSTPFFLPYFLFFFFFCFLLFLLLQEFFSVINRFFLNLLADGKGFVKNHHHFYAFCFLFLPG